MKRGLIFFSLISVLSCGGSGSPGYEAAKLTLEEQEKLSPVGFLRVEGEYRFSLFLNDLVIEGKVTSNAKVASYKDIVLKVDLYTKTNTYVGSEEYVLYEFITPGQSMPFELEIDVPEEVNQASVTVLKASPVE